MSVSLALPVGLQIGLLFSDEASGVYVSKDKMKAGAIYFVKKLRLAK